MDSQLIGLWRITTLSTNPIPSIREIKPLPP
jgi:hypothetical protein